VSAKYQASVIFREPEKLILQEVYFRKMKCFVCVST